MGNTLFGIKQNGGNALPLGIQQHGPAWPSAACRRQCPGQNQFGNHCGMRMTNLSSGPSEGGIHLSSTRRQQTVATTKSTRSASTIRSASTRRSASTATCQKKGTTGKITRKTSFSDVIALSPTPKRTYHQIFSKLLKTSQNFSKNVRLILGPGFHGF